MAETKDTLATKAPVRKAPPQKNELSAVHIPESGLYKVKYTGAGATPLALSGTYTTATIAEKAISLYLNKKKK